MHAVQSPTKIGRSQMRMKREFVPRNPQVSVVTRTVYASSTSVPVPIPVEDTPIPLGAILGGLIGGMMLVLVVVGGWYCWGAKKRMVQAKDTKARRAQDMAKVRSGHGKSESTDTLNTRASHSKSDSSHISEKSDSSMNHEPVQKPSDILAAQKKSPRSPFMHQTTSSASLASSKYAPARPSPLSLNVVNRAPSAMSQHSPTVVVTAPPQSGSPGLSPQSAALRSLVPLPPKVNVVPPSPPPPVRILPAHVEGRNVRQSVQSVQSVQTVASEYSLDSPVGIAYGGDETSREIYVNPRDTWRESNKDMLSRDPFVNTGDSKSR